MAAWYKVMRGAAFVNYASARSVFNSADKVGQFTVFNVGGDGYRVVVVIHSGGMGTHAFSRIVTKPSMRSCDSRPHSALPGTKGDAHIFRTAAISVR